MRFSAAPLLILAVAGCCSAADWDDDKDHKWTSHNVKPYKCGQVSPHSQIKTDGEWVCLGPGEVLCRDYSDAKLPVDGVYKFGIDASHPKGVVRLWDGNDEVVWEDWLGAQEICIKEKPTCGAPPPSDTTGKPGWWQKPGKVRGRRQLTHEPYCDPDPQPYFVVCGEGGCKHSSWKSSWEESVIKIAEVTCGGVGNDDLNTQLKLVDLVENKPNYNKPFSIAKMKRGMTPNPDDENELWAIKIIPPEMSSWYSKNGYYSAELSVNSKFCALTEHDGPKPPPPETKAPTATPCLLEATAINKDSTFIPLKKGDEVGYSVSASNGSAMIGIPGAGSNNGAIAVTDLISKKSYIATAKDAGSRAGTAVSTDGSSIATGAPGNSDGFIAYADISDLMLKDMPSGADMLDLIGVGSNRRRLKKEEEGGWTITPSSGGDAYGESIAISGNYLVVGGPDADKAKLFEVDTSNPVLKDVFEGEHGSKFGTSVDLDTSTGFVAVGAPKEGSGKVYLYRGHGGPHQTLEPPTGGLLFGQSLAMSGSVLAVGGPGFDNGQGCVFIFHLKDEKWEYKATIFAKDGKKGDFFGQSVSVDKGLMVVGAPKAKGSTGAAYLFKAGDKGWTLVYNLSLSSDLDGSTLAEGDRFGFSVAVCAKCNTAMIGSPGADDDTGAVYFIDLGSKCDN